MAEVAPLDTEDSGPQALQKELFIHLQNFESLPPQETAPLDLDQPRSLMFIDGNEKIQNHQTGDRNLDQINISSNDQLIEKYKVHHTCNGPEAKVSNKQSSVEQILHRLPIANQPTSPSKIDETFLKNISIYDSHDSTNTEESFDCTKNSASTDPALEATTFEASEKYNLYETSVKVESFADTKFEFSENISITKSIAISSSTDTFYSLASSKDDSNPPSSDSLSPDTLHQTSFTSIEDSILQKNVDVLTADFSNIDFNLVACETRILNVDLSSTGSYKQPNDEIDPSCDDLINESEDEILRENHNPNHHFCQNKSSEFDKLNQEISKDSGSNVSLDKKMNPTMYGKMVKTIQHQFKKILSLGVNNNKECLKPLKNTEKDRINQQDSFQEISNATTTILTSASAQSPITQVAPENSDTSPSYQPPQCNSALLESYRMYTSMNLCSFVSFFLTFFSKLSSSNYIMCIKISTLL